MRNRTIGKEVYVDWGVAKPHTVLIGRSGKSSHVNDLGSLGIRGCSVYFEQGCPRTKLARIAKENRLFTVDGAAIKALRDSKGKAKSDTFDVALIRELAKRNPQAFRELDAKDKREIAEQAAYAYYCHLTALIASLKNRQKSFEREFGHQLPELKAALTSLEEGKEKATVFFSRFAPDTQRLAIRGLGPRLLGGILLRAAPSRFPSLSAYLGYCGLKAHAVRGGRYSRHVRALYHQLATSTIMHKDAKFYHLYQKVKRDLRRRYPGYSAGRIEGMARNRLATFLAKQVFLSVAPATNADQAREHSRAGESLEFEQPASSALSRS